MTDKNWKALERRIADMLNTTRTPLSGSNGKQTSSDTLSETYYVEVKYRKKIPFFTTFKDTVEKAKKENKKPIVVFHEANSKKNIVMLDIEDFLELENITKSL